MIRQPTPELLALRQALRRAQARIEHPAAPTPGRTLAGVPESPKLASFLAMQAVLFAFWVGVGVVTFRSNAVWPEVDVYWTFVLMVAVCQWFWCSSSLPPLLAAHRAVARNENRRAQETLEPVEAPEAELERMEAALRPAP